MIGAEKDATTLTVSEQEYELIMVVRRKFQRCECCVSRLVELIEGMEKKT